MIGAERAGTGRAPDVGGAQANRDVGWTIAAVGLLCSALSSPGQSFAIGFYLDPLMEASGLSRVGISALYSAATLLAALALPALGALADRTAAHRFLAVVLALLAGAMLLLAATNGPVVLAIAFFSLRLLGQGAVGLGTVTLIARRYDRRLARAFALTALGYAAGELVFPGAIVGLIQTVGWRGSLVVMAACYLLLFVPFVNTVGAAGSGRHPRGAAPSLTDVSPDPASYSLRAAARRPVFWGLLAVVALPPLVMTAVLFHQVALLASVGGGLASASTAMMAFAVGGIAGTFPGTLVLERMPPRAGIALGMTLMGAAFATLYFAGAGGAGHIAYGLLLGLAAGVVKVAGTYVWPVYFGTGHVGAIKGTVNAVRNGATALGPPIAALIAGPGEAFDGVLLPFAAASLVAGAVTLVLRPPGPAERS
jgi:predicted MFS family arabinose efflux permease